MAEVFRVDILDHTGTVVSSLKNFQYFSAEIRVANRDSFRLQLDDSDPNAESIKEDYVLQLWYKDEVLNISWINVFTGIIKTISRVWYSNGRKLDIFYGSGNNEILDKAIIAYPSDVPQSNKDGNALDVAYDMVVENVGDSARITNGRYFDHINPITVEKVGTCSLNWSSNVAHDLLIRKLQDIRDFSYLRGDRIDFETIYTGGYTWKIRVGKIYNDRTLDGLDVTTGKNGAGNVPIVLSPRYNNVQDFVQTKSRIAEENMILALGRYLGSSREFTVVSDTNSIAASPIAQREALFQAQNTEDLQFDVEARLKDSIGKVKLSIQPKFTPAFALFRDINVGDFFSVVGLDGTVENKQFEELKIRVQQTTGGSTISDYTMFIEQREPT